MERMLKKFLKTGKEWEKLETEFLDIRVVKTGTLKHRKPNLIIEINPVDKEERQVLRHGFYIRNSRVLKEYQQLLNDPRLVKLIKEIRKVNRKYENSQNCQNK